MEYEISDSSEDSSEDLSSEYDSEAESDIEIDPENTHTMYLIYDNNSNIKLGITKNEETIISRYNTYWPNNTLYYSRKTTYKIARNLENLLKNLLIMHIKGEIMHIARGEILNISNKYLEFLKFLSNLIINLFEEDYRIYHIKLLKHPRRRTIDITNMDDYFPPNLCKLISSELIYKYLDLFEIEKYIGMEINYIIELIINKIHIIE